MTSTGGTPTGVVTFTIDSSSAVTGTLSGGRATYVTSTLAVGTNAVTATYGGGDGFVGSSATLAGCQTVISNPDLSGSSKTASSATVTPGGSVTYTIVLSNSGTTDAFGARVTDTLPAGLSYVSSAATSSTPVHSGGVVTWTGTVSLSVPVTLTIRASADSPQTNGSIITNTANIDDGNGVVTNKSTAVTITSAPDLSSSTKTASAVNVGKGDTLTYTITLNDTGTANATGVSVTDPLPSQLTFVTATASSGPSPTYSGGSVSWTGPVTVGAPVRISVSGTVNNNVPDNSPITNTVTIGDGVGNSITKTATVWLLPPPVSGNVYPVGGGTLTGTLSATGGTTTTISFPTGAVTDAVTVIFTPTLQCPAGSMRALDNCFLLEARNSGGQIVTHFAMSYTITIYYTAAQVGNGDENSLKIYYFNEASSQWEALPTTVDKVNKVLMATVDHMTKFTVMVNTQYTVRLITVYKNYRADQVLSQGRRSSLDGRLPTIQSLLGATWLVLTGMLR